jgi:hypothetical protein
VRITLASVVREAGRSRNPLYTTHRNILDEIGAAANAPGPRKDLAARLAELEAELAMLRAEARPHAEEKRLARNRRPRAAVSGEACRRTARIEPTAGEHARHRRDHHAAALSTFEDCR